MKVGRNQICPYCKSGKKYKFCCGNPRLLQKVAEGSRKAVEEHKAKELIRQQQQGLGNPIVSTEYQGHQVVAVGNTVHFSPNWKTFADFLFTFLKTTMGEDWGNSELKKALEDRHPILQWHDMCCRLQGETPRGEIRKFPSVGAVICFLGLSYSLYLLKHNVELQNIYIDRLKNIDEFQGAYYELMIANALIRAGFELELEDETDQETKHCEFAAISKKTGKRYWVEAKMRGVKGVLGKTDLNGTKNKNPTCMLSKHINQALEKPAADDRIIFVDVNTSLEDDPSKWVQSVEQKIDQKERDLKEGQEAYLFVTNMGYHWNPKIVSARGHPVIATGLGIPDFIERGHFTFTEVYKRKQRHIDAHNIMVSMRDYPKVPTTFDGALPSEKFEEVAMIPKIGETYFLESVGGDGLEATVTTAIVNEHDKTMMIGTDKGQILTSPISEEQIEDYKNHPDAFFGKVHEQGKSYDNPYEFFERMVEIHMAHPKETIIEKCKNFPGAEKMEHEDLVLTYCENIVAQIQSKKAD